MSCRQGRAPPDIGTCTLVFVGLVDQDAQGTSGRIDLDTAHRQSGVDDTLDQACGLGRLVGRGGARALFGWLRGVVGLGHGSPSGGRGETLCSCLSNDKWWGPTMNVARQIQFSQPKSIWLTRASLWA